MASAAGGQVRYRRTEELDVARFDQGEGQGMLRSVSI